MIALASVLVLAAAGATFGYFRWQHHQEIQSLLRRSTEGRNIGQALAVLANQTRDSYTLPDGRRAPLSRRTIQDTLTYLAATSGVPVKPRQPGLVPEGFDGPWWLIASDPTNNDFSAVHVLLYENPDLNTDHILIVFNDAHVNAYSRTEALALIEDELAQSRLRHASVTWPVPLLPPEWP